jgi:hypothetical protein
MPARGRELIGVGSVLCCSGSIDQVVGAAVDKVDVRADRIGIVVQRELGRAQFELICLVVEVVKLVELVWSARWEVVRGDSGGGAGALVQPCARRLLPVARAALSADRGSHGACCADSGRR